MILRCFLLLILSISMAVGGAFVETNQFIVEPAYFSLYGWVFGFISGFVLFR